MNNHAPKENRNTAAVSQLVLHGKLQEISTQARIATEIGCHVSQLASDIVIEGERDVRMALLAFFHQSAPGWQRYRDIMINMKICSATQFDEAFEANPLLDS